MRTRSQSRGNFPQQEASPAIVEPLRIENPFLEDQFQEDPPKDPPEVPMADDRTMAELLRASTEGYEDAIVIPEIAANNFELKLDLNKTQGASTPGEVKRMQNVPYASSVGFIINPEAELRVDCYCNAGFETDIDDMKSQTEYVFILNGKRKAEMEAVWIRKFISGFGIVPTINKPIKMFAIIRPHFLLPTNWGFRRGPNTTIEDVIMFASVLN
nr:hypothetical protein [Tanacetum cinerariifolium]